MYLTPLPTLNIGASDFTIKSFFGLTDTYFQLTDVDCRGDEASLQECPKSYNVRSCNTHSVAGVHCIPLMAKHVTKTHHEMAIIGLTIALAITVSILFLVLLYMHRDRFISLKVKVGYSLNQSCNEDLQRFFSNNCPSVKDSYRAMQCIRFLN